jgi:hypothetical protein
VSAYNAVPDTHMSGDVHDSISSSVVRYRQRTVEVVVQVWKTFFEVASGWPILMVSTQIYQQTSTHFELPDSPARLLIVAKGIEELAYRH